MLVLELLIDVTVHVVRASIIVAGKSQRGIPLFCTLCGKRHASLDGRLPSVGFRRDPSVLFAWWGSAAVVPLALSVELEEEL